MSIFGYLLGGAAEGIGKEGLREDELEEKRRGTMDLQRERLSAASALQSQRAADKEYQMELLATLKGGGSGSGRGKGDYNLFEQLQTADTPDKQARLVESVRAFQGEDAANVISRVFGGKPATAEVAPTTGDFARFDRGQTDDLPATTRQPVSVDVEKGRTGLQRLLALAMDPAKLDAYSKGEAQIMRNDAAAGTVADAKRAGGGVDAMNEALTPLNPKAGMDADKNSIAAERLRVQREAEAGKNSRSDATLSERDARSTRDGLLKERKLLEKTAMSALADDADIATAKDRIRSIDEQLKALSAAKPSANAGATPTWIPDEAQAEQRRIIEEELKQARAANSPNVPGLERELARLGGAKPATATAPNRRDLFKVIR